MRDDGGTAAGNVQAATALVRDDGVFALAPVITPDLGASGRPPHAAGAVLRLGRLVELLRQPVGLLVHGVHVPAGWRRHQRRVGRARASGARRAGTREDGRGREREHGIGEVLRAHRHRRGRARSGLRVVSATTPLSVPAVADYDALAKQLLTANGGAPPDAVFVAASYANVAQLRQALRNNGYAGVFTDTVEYEPDLVAAATGALVFAPTAAVETAATNPAMQQLVADVNAVAPGLPIDQSTVAGYWSADLLIAAVERAGPKLTPDRLVKRANSKFTYRGQGHRRAGAVPRGPRRPGAVRHPRAGHGQRLRGGGAVPVREGRRRRVTSARVSRGR